MKGFNIGSLISLGDMELAIDYLNNKELFEEELKGKKKDTIENNEEQENVGGSEDDLTLIADDSELRLVIDEKEESKEQEVINLDKFEDKGNIEEDSEEEDYEYDISDLEAEEYEMDLSDIEEYVDEEAEYEVQFDGDKGDDKHEEDLRDEEEFEYEELEEIDEYDIKADELGIEDEDYEESVKNYDESIEDYEYSIEADKADTESEKYEIDMEELGISDGYEINMDELGISEEYEPGDDKDNAVMQNEYRDLSKIDKKTISYNISQKEHDNLDELINKACVGVNSNAVKKEEKGSEHKVINIENRIKQKEKVNEIEIYSKMEIKELYKEVRKYMEDRGVRKGVIDLAELENKFGKNNIRKLILKSYLILVGKGVTVGK